MQAVSGGALYRKSSFLLDSLGKQVFPKHIDILEDPFILRRQGQLAVSMKKACACTRARWWMPGRVEGYFLSAATRRANWA